MTWKQFHFESNMFFDNIAGPADWLRLKAAYPTMSDDDLLDAKEATYDGHRTKADRDSRPNYGLRGEHDGVKRLRDFFEENDMLRLIPGHAGDTSKQIERLNNGNDKNIGRDRTRCGLWQFAFIAHEPGVWIEGHASNSRRTIGQSCNVR